MDLSVCFEAMRGRLKMEKDLCVQTCVCFSHALLTGARQLGQLASLVSHESMQAVWKE